MVPAVRTLLPMAADGVGPSLTCTRLVDGLHRAGTRVDVWVNRTRHGGTEIARIHRVLPGPLARLPYKLVAARASGLLERLYLDNLAEGEVAWLWPTVSLKLHETIRARGNPIVLEGINTRMASAKQVLDAAYEAFGAAPGHGITEARIAEEETKIALAQAIFAPSEGVEAALAGTPLADRFIASSYGVDTRNPPRPRGPRRQGPVTFLFVGYACVRKGIHHLFDIWPQMPEGARLRIVGRIEPLIAERYAGLLASDRIEAVGFTRDVASHYAVADAFVFPSLEEGDPLVTYEAALHGLPILASRPGAGRMGLDRGIATIIDPTDREAFLAALVALWRDPDLRAARGAAARAAVADYDWDLVGARRATALAARFDIRKDPVPPEKTRPGSPVAAPGLIRPPPSVSVVLPAYNREHAIRGSVESVLRQTWDAFELIVVDDCSSDRTCDVVRSIRDPRVRLIENPRNLGPSGARNAGVREAQGDWVAFQDSDDEWLPKKLERQIARVREPGRDWIAVYCGMGIEGHVFPQQGGRTQLRYIPDPSVTLVEGDIRSTLLTKSLVSTQTLMVSRAAFERAGGFDESMPALEDWDLTLRLAGSGHFAFVDELLVIQRFSPNSITGDRIKWITARLQILDKHQKQLSAFPDLLSRQYQVLAGQYRQLGRTEEALRALRKARAITPGNVGVWTRTGALALAGVLQRTGLKR